MPHPHAEWLETDGLGGFASGTVGLRRARRYHGLLIAPTQSGRVMLLNGFDAQVKTKKGSFWISSQHYAPGVEHPNGAQHIERFESHPWPRWIFNLDHGSLRIAQEIFMVHGSSTVVIAWSILEGSPEAALIVRPMVSGRDYHSLHHENPAFDFTCRENGLFTWTPYPDLPSLHLKTNGHLTPKHEWYRQFLYAEERERGLDHVEDLACIGQIDFDLKREAYLIGSVEQPGEMEELRQRERERRARFASRLHRSADAYVVKRGEGRTIIAGYPWFTDWGRDTFISLRGLCLATGRIDDALSILRAWSPLVSEGMLPNRFPDRGEPELNSVDASLWYAVAVFDLLEAMKRRRIAADPGDLRLFRGAIEQIVDGYSRGTRYGIRLDDDGLIAAGEPGVQLTWMDAKVGDWVVTPRIGKPVEIQALWLNTLRIAMSLGIDRSELYLKGLASFRAKYIGEEHLFDVVDPNDDRMRPNQIFAVGGLPFPILEGEEARRVVDAVEERLLTPAGLRTLDPSDPDYRGHYRGGVMERDGAYHQGTVWPWLMGPFVEAWVRVRGGTAEAKELARAKFLKPMLANLESSGLGHIAEIADGEPPHLPRGCPFQAWSLGEAIRLSQLLLD